MFVYMFALNNTWPTTWPTLLDDTLKNHKLFLIEVVGVVFEKITHEEKRPKYNNKPIKTTIVLGYSPSVEK